MRFAAASWSAIGVLVVVFLPGAVSAQEFGYYGDLGPRFWGALSSEWTACSNGELQSPVDFGHVTLHSRKSRNLSLHYGVTKGEIFNNGHTVEVETEGHNALRSGGENYELVQFHFHTPSEHRFEGEGFDMEMHLVHKSESGATAVVGVFLRRGPDSGPLAVVFEHLPAVDAPLNTKTELPRFDVSRFLPSSMLHNRYLGSLTTPPCTEGVQWFVLHEPITVSDEDMAQFGRRVAFNARPVQRRSW